MRRAAVAAVVAMTVAVTVALAGVVPSAVAAGEGDEMSLERAGKYYMKVTCVQDAERVRFNRIVFGADDGVTADEVRRRLPEFKRAAGAFATANYRWARGLLNPPAAWPSNVAGPIDSASTKVLAISDALRAASRASSPTEWARQVGKAARLNRQTPSATIRARLDLPPPGRGC